MKMAESLCVGNVIGNLEANIITFLRSSMPEIAEESIKIYWPSKKGGRTLGCTVNLECAANMRGLEKLSLLHQSWLDEIASSLLEQSKSWTVTLDRCSIVANSCLLLSFNVALLTSSILTKIATTGSSYGKASEKLLPILKKNVLIHITYLDIKNCNLTDARTIYTMQFVRRLLEFCSDSTVFCTMQLDKRCRAFSTCDSHCELDISRQRGLIVSSIQNVSPSLVFPSDCDGRKVSINLKKYVGDNPSSFHLGLSLPDCPFVILDDGGESTKCLTYASDMEHIVKEHASLIDSCLLISSPCTSYNSFVSTAVWHLLSEHKTVERKPSITLYENGTVTFKGSHSCSVRSVEELYRVKFEETKDCFTHKYGFDGYDVAKSQLDVMFTDLTDFCIKFEMLRCAISSPVTLHSQKESRSKSGEFIMYGYARMASLLQRYEVLVRSGDYPPLPDSRDTDFSTLTQQEENNLVILCGQYPELMEDVFQQVITRSATPPAIHKILRYLTEFNQNLSIFYSRVHILGKPVPQLFPKMFARLWLLKSVKQIFENIFALLEVTPIQQL